MIVGRRSLLPKCQAETMASAPTMMTARAAMSDVARSARVVRKKLRPELPRSSRSHCLSSSGEGLVVLGETESSHMSAEGRGSGAPRAPRRPSRGIGFGVCLGWVPVAECLFGCWEEATQHGISLGFSGWRWTQQFRQWLGHVQHLAFNGFRDQRDLCIGEKRRRKGRAGRRRTEDSPESVPNETKCAKGAGSNRGC